LAAELVGGLHFHGRKERKEGGRHGEKTAKKGCGRKGDRRLKQALHDLGTKVKKKEKGKKGDEN